MDIRRTQRNMPWLGAGVCATLLASGCSIISPAPLWEMAKATGMAAGMTMQTAPGQSSDTVHHPHEPVKDLCIEFNPQTQVGDIVPALQTALRAHQIESRVYDSAIGLQRCKIWLRYSASIDWDRPPMNAHFTPYVSQAALTLQTANGIVLSNSHYRIDDMFKTSKWASTRDKLAPVVTALITGIEQRPTPSSATTEQQP